VNSSERIAFNTAATYTRSILAVCLALFGSRWILSALGETDFGLFSVVGSLIVFLSFFNSVMASSAARHFAYAIGQEDIIGVNKWFNTSLSIHLVLPVGLIIIGWPIAEYLVRNVLTIPPERIGVCVQVFRISLISAFVNMVSIPFVAMFHAKQRISELAIWGVMQAVLIFLLAFVLAKIPFDRLVFYAVGMVVIQVTIQIAQCSRAVWLFRECRFRFLYWFDIRRFKELANFAIWTMIGRFGGTLRDQGSAVLLNLYFGPSVNAAYGIANQVSVQTAGLSAAMMGALSPEITFREAQGQRDSMIDLSARACKFGALLVMLFAIPFIMEADLVFKLWLINPPTHAAVLSQFIMGTFLVDKIAAGYMHAVNAYGKIALYQATVGTVLLMTLPLSWVLIKLGMPPVAIGFAFLFIQSLCSFGRVLWVQFLFGIPVWHWLNKVVRPCFMVAVMVCLAGAIPRFFLPPGLTRLVLVCVASTGTIIFASWMVAFTFHEKLFIAATIKRAKNSIAKQLHPSVPYK